MNPARTRHEGRGALRSDRCSGQDCTVRLRLNDQQPGRAPIHSVADFDEICRTASAAEADEFYATVIPATLSDDARTRRAAGVRRAALVEAVLPLRRQELARRRSGAAARRRRSAQDGRNHEWTHLYNADVISMPDKWEYPWYAAWDLAFHCVPLALVDSDFAKEQLLLLLREWYMHPNGQLPAYEWALRRRESAGPRLGGAGASTRSSRNVAAPGDRAFLERVFHKLLLNFTWWVNRKDAEGMNVFQGGFLGLDNIGVFDRSAPLPTGGHLEQSDGTSWMAMYSLNMLAIAIELAKREPGLRGRRQQVLGALPQHRARDERRPPARRARPRPVGRRGRLLLRRAAHAGRSTHAAARSARWSA